MRRFSEKELRDMGCEIIDWDEFDGPKPMFPSKASKGYKEYKEAVDYYERHILDD